jgi:SAM-dependent methyltransferase
MIKYESSLFRVYDYSPQQLSDLQSDLVREYNQNYDQQLIPLIDAICLCGSEHFATIALYDTYGLKQPTVLCCSCGLMQSNPRPTEEWMANFYESNTYHSLYVDHHSQSDHAIHTSGPLEIFDCIATHLSIDSSLSVLEVGSYQGNNLRPFREAGANVQGVEPSRDAVRTANAKGIPTIPGNIHSVRGKFDVIILNHVLEHLHDPIAGLKHLRLRLSKHGLIYIAVPNILIFSGPQLQNAHIYYFTPKQFEYYCNCSGLTMIAGGETQYRHSYGVFSPSSYPQQLTTPRSSGLQIRLRIIRHRLRGLIVRIVRGLRLLPIIDTIRSGPR